METARNSILSSRKHLRKVTPSRPRETSDAIRERDAERTDLLQHILLCRMQDWTEPTEYTIRNFRGRLKVQGWILFFRRLNVFHLASS